MVSTALKNTKLWVDLDAVSDITGVEISTLLDWQRFFYPFLAPDTVRGEPRYTKEDIHTVLHIKRLIHHGGLRKEGAKKALAWSSKRAA
jgi:DNA-binding transcriptional MerR regulator